MKYSSTSCAILFLLVTSVPLCESAQAEEAFMLDNGNALVMVQQSWSGRIENPALRKMIPSSGVVTNAEDWKSLWDQ